jgi:ketosteroid isomerase-like protein
MRIGNAVALLVTCTALAGCTGRTSSDPDAAGLRRASDRYRTALNAADTVAFFRLLADDVELFPPATTPISGSAAHDLYRGLLKQFAVTLDPLSKEEWIVGDDLAVQRYSFRLMLRPKASGQATVESGSGVHVWRRASDGQWRLAKDIWTVVPASAKS